MGKWVGLGLSQDKIQWFCKNKKQIPQPYKNVPPPLEGPRAQPHPVVGMGGGVVQAISQRRTSADKPEHLASTAGSEGRACGGQGPACGAASWEDAGTDTHR